MPKSRTLLPRRVYKYRSFSNASIESLIDDTLFFANPATFNDPLDSKPTLEIDLNAAELEAVLRTLVERRISSEMKAAASTMRYSGPKTVEHIAKQGRRRADEMIAKIQDHATDPDYEMDDPLQSLLGYRVEEELLRRYDRGIVSLAGRATCPLMWSHYADQHRGVCFGYSVPADVRLHPVSYGGARSVKASLVAAMLKEDAGASALVDAAALLTKAREWRYEREWRLLGDRGTHDSPLELEEVVFGLRCPATVQFVVATALKKRERQVKLYEICERRGTFQLKKDFLDTGEMMVRWPRRARAIHEWLFEDESLEENSPSTSN